MKSPFNRRPICVLWLLFFLNAAGDAQEISLEMVGLNKMRTGGPVALEFDLTKSTPRPVTGQLRLHLLDFNGAVTTLFTDEITLSAQKTRQRLMVPNADSLEFNDALTLHASFQTANKSYNMGSRPVRVSARSERILRILSVTNEERVDNDVTDLIRSLEFQQFWFPHRSDPNRQQAMMQWQNTRRNRPRAKFDVASTTIYTTQEPVMVDDLSPIPLWYNNYNVVVLFKDAFENLRKSQIDAIETWVRAGGSVCIEPLGILDDTQIEFLERITKGSDFEIQMTPEGGVVTPEDRSFGTFHYDLGRVVLLYRPVDTADDNRFDSNDVTWRNEGVTFLWQYRKDQIPYIKQSGYWEWLDSSRVGYIYNNFRGLESPEQRLAQLLYEPAANGRGLFDRLMPHEVQVVPIGYIALILVLYVATIGPLDYCVLGLLKLRRFTWVTFPVMTLLFTLITVWLSNSYLGSNVERTFVSIIDVGDDGKIIRENRFELLYTASSHEVATSARSSLFTPLDIGRWTARNTRFGNRQAEGAMIPATLIGRPPMSVEATQSMPQWTPQMNRLFTYKCRDETALKHVRSFNWKKQWDLQSGNTQAQILNAARSAFGGAVDVAIFDGARSRLDQVSHLFGGNASQGFLRDICMRQQGGGLFGVVSRVAPQGGDTLEDLTMIDPSSQEYLLVFAVEDGESGLRIYRKLYRETAR